MRQGDLEGGAGWEAGSPKAEVQQHFLPLLPLPVLVHADHGHPSQHPAPTLAMTISRFQHLLPRAVGEGKKVREGPSAFHGGVKLAENSPRMRTGLFPAVLWWRPV